MNRTRTITLLVTALVFLGMVSAGAAQVWPKTPPGALEPDTQSFTFAVCGDNRPSGDKPVPAIYYEVLRSINATDARFVINTGDFISGTTDIAVMNRQIDDFIAATEMLEVPMYIAFGNHELRNAECLQVLEERIGPRYFAFNYGNSRFYVLNTYLPGQPRISGEQLEWFRNDLATEGARMQHRFVFFHTPMYSPMNDIGRRSWGDPENLALLQQVLAENNVDAVFNGHDHYFAWRMVDGVQHIVTGGAGAPLYEAPGALSIYHYMLVEVNGDRVSIRLVPVELPPEPAGEVIVPRGSTGWRVTVDYPTEAPPDQNGTHWFEPGYDVSGWAAATLPVGYKHGGELPIATQVADNDGDYYLVGSFTAPEGIAERPLRLLVNSDNGAIIYINGQLVDDDPAAHQGSGHNPQYWNREAEIKPGIVQPGENHVAVRLVNNAGSSDAFFDMEIVAPK